MKPTAILSSEHRVIEVALDCLEQIARRALHEKKLDKAAAEQVVDFIRTFADRCHHGKEEELLFTALVEKGMPREGGPIGQMLVEHEQGRAFVKSMAESTAEAAAGDSGALQRFAENAQGYIQLLRAHIRKEDGVLFPMAEQILSSDDQKALLASFEKVETEHMGLGTHEKYLRLAESLADRFGVSREGLAVKPCGCGH